MENYVLNTFVMEGCPHCIKVKNDDKNGNLKKSLENVVSGINVYTYSHGGKNDEIFEKNDVSAFPTFILTNKKTNKTYRREGGYGNISELVDFVEDKKKEDSSIKPQTGGCYTLVGGDDESDYDYENNEEYYKKQYFIIKKKYLSMKKKMGR